MFEAIKNNLKRKKAVRLLVLVASFGTAGTYLPKEDVDLLVSGDASLIEVGPANAEGKVGLRVTPAGATAAATVPAEQPKAAAVAPSNFTIEKNIPIPIATRGARGVVYPFETMEVGDSFLVAKTEAKPNPAKSLASTVSAASKRLAPKKFTVRATDAGARIWREA